MTETTTDVRAPGAAHGAPGVPGVPGGDVPLRWVWLAAWPVTAVFVLSNAATPLYVLWQREMGFSRGTLTVVFACYIAGLLGSLLVSGVVSDRLGRKPVLLPALGLALVSCLVFATAGGVAALIVARLCTGIAVGAVVSAGMAAVTDVAGPARRPLAALLASCAMVFGAGSGPLLAGVLSETLPGPTVTVFAVEAVLLVTAVAVVLRMPVRRPTRADTRSGAGSGSGGPGSGAGTGNGGTGNGETRNGETRNGGTGSGVGNRAGAGAGGGAWVRVPGVPRGAGRQLALGIAVFAPGITATSFVLSLGPSLLSGLLGTGSRIVSGALAFVMFLSATGVQFAVRGLGRRTILLAGAAATVLGMLALVTAVHTGSVSALAGAALLAGAGQGMGQLGGLSLLNSTVPAGRLAEANAALNVGGYLPAGVLPVTAGYLSDAVGLTAGATVFGTALAALAAAGGGLVLRGWREPAEPLG
ncbi:MFS transporter [Streptomyces sp. 5-8]|uniref:MFS transporter n=1 Tax=Streptomyces musisoli TaxID=2802280 RepID=A0ABS1P7J8_9ACTN|nr:MFS transporter [Streptomyces musisoli]MBL1108336.1 MFS transporter [Streptomyces musisoli]